MIVTRTPFRVTLGGGGTDLPSFYEKYGGFILAMGIDKYMYVMLNQPSIERYIRLHYTRSETVAHVSELQHELAREALLYHGIEYQMEISSMADLSAGTGMGSSSAYLVGLLTALHHYRRDYVSIQTVAEEACDIELNILKKGIGKQDQYISAYGGVTALDIATDGSVTPTQVHLDAGASASLVANTHIYYTGVQRDAEQMLAPQDMAMKSAGDARHSLVTDSLNRIKELGLRSLEAIEAEDFDAWGLLLHDHWQNKKQLSGNVAPPTIDDLYEHVRSEYGVLGGKIIGAGGGGFLLLYVPREHKRLDEFMRTQGMERLHYMIEPEGAKVVASFSVGPQAHGRPAAAEGPRPPRGVDGKRPAQADPHVGGHAG